MFQLKVINEDLNFEAIAGQKVGHVKFAVDVSKTTSDSVKYNHSIAVTPVGNFFDLLA
jgi:hypothetical protein